MLVERKKNDISPDCGELDRVSIKVKYSLARLRAPLAGPGFFLAVE